MQRKCFTTFSYCRSPQKAPFSHIFSVWCLINTTQLYSSLDRIPDCMSKMNLKMRRTTSWQIDALSLCVWFNITDYNACNHKIHLSAIIRAVQQGLCLHASYNNAKCWVELFYGSLCQSLSATVCVKNTHTYYESTKR